MKILFRNFPEIKREKFSNEESYNKAVSMQSRQINSYKKRVRIILITVISLAVLAVLSLLVFGAVKLVNRLSAPKSDFNVRDTVLNKRSVNPKKVKLYGDEEIKISGTLTVCIDPGHGGEEPGETLEDSEGTIIRSEKIDNMELGLLLQEKLESFGVTVIMTRTGDTRHTNQERCELANQSNADLFVSLHRNNEVSDTSKKGVDIYVPSKKLDFSDVSYQTGEYILQYLDASGISQNYGTHVGSITSEQYDFQMNRDTNMPSLVIELGYISNEEDNLLYDLNKERYASAIAYGILKQFAPECISQMTEPGGHIRKNNLIFDYSSLSEEDITYAIASSDKTDFNHYVSEIRNFEDAYGGFASEFIIDSTENEVYLTFDTGSDAGYVREILDILDKKSVKALFFINYTFAANHPDLIREMIAKGHTIGNGSKDFPESGFSSMTEKEQKEQVFDLHEYVLFHYNYCMSLFRFPNGHFSPKSLAMVNNYQYISIFWSYSYNDYTALGFTEEDVLNSMVDAIQSGIIYDLRTDSEMDLNVLSSFIDSVYDKDYKIGLLY